MNNLPAPRRRENRSSPDPRVLRCVRQALLAGLALVVVWPAARGYNPWIGWWPLWLLGMPAVAWWSLYRFHLPGFLRLPRRARSPRRRGQARRTRASAVARRAQLA
jgi:hypothetical protein